MKISIIVPIYNVEDYLEECLESLVNQSLMDIEIILIDDGSTDQSSSICDRYAQSDRRVKVMHQPNGGQSRARNNGVKMSMGEYILFVDSDDYIRENACEVLYSLAKETGADIVWGDLDNCWDSKQSDRARRFPSYNKVVSSYEIMKEALNVQAYDIVPVLKLVRRDLFKNEMMQFLDGCYYEDQEYTLKMLLTGASVLRIDFPFYHYRAGRPGSTTTVHNLKKGTDFIQVIHTMIDDIHQISIPTEYRSYAESIVAMAVYHLSAIYVYMTSEDRRMIQKLITVEIKAYAQKTRHLSMRMKIQNRLFILCPSLLHHVFKLKDLLMKQR